MSVESLATVLNHSKARGTARLVVIGIANHDGEGGAWVGIAKLCQYAGGVDERNVQRALAKLVGMGEIRVHYNDGGTHNTPDHMRPNRYDVLVSCPSWCDHTGQHRDTRKLSGRQLRLPSTTPSTAVDQPPGASATPSPVPPGASATTPPGASATRTTHKNQPPSVVSQLQDAREALDRRPCADCGQAELPCQQQQQHWLEDDRHDYRPAAVRHAKA